MGDIVAVASVSSEIEECCKLESDSVGAEEVSDSEADADMSDPKVEADSEVEADVSYSREVSEDVSDVSFL